MNSEPAIGRKLPEEARKPYHRFLFGFCFSVFFMAILCVFLNYHYVMDHDAGMGAVPIAFVGLLMTTMVGAAGARCIHSVAVATKDTGTQDATGQNGGER